MFIDFVFKGPYKSVLNKLQYHHPVTMISLIYCKTYSLSLPICCLDYKHDYLNFLKCINICNLFLDLSKE